MNPASSFFSTFETSASSVWDAWKKIETTVDAAVGLPVVAPAAVTEQPVTEKKVEPSPVKVEEEKHVSSEHESQLLRLAERNAQLESELQALQTANSSSDAVGEFSARLGQVEARLRAMTNERDAARKELENVRKEAEARTEAATRDLRESMALLQRDADLAKRTEQEVRSEGEKLAKQIGKLEMLLKNVRAQLAEKTTALEAESTRAADAESKLQETQKELHAVKEELRKWEGSTESLKTLGARAAGELQELKQSDSELKKKLAESQQALESAWSDLASVRKEMAQKVQEAVESARAESNEAREKWKRNLQQKTSEWADKEKSLKESLHALRAEIARKEESYEWRIHAQSEKERDLKARLEQAESSLADERSGRSQAQAPLIEEARKLREMLRDAEEQTTALRSSMRVEMEGIENEKRELRTRLQDVEAERDKWKDGHSVLTQKLARVETKCAEACASVELERGNLDQLREEHETIKALSRKLKEENDKLRADHVKCRDELASAQTRLEAAVSNARQALKTSASQQSVSTATTVVLGGGVVADEERSVSFTQTRLEREVAVLQAELVRASQEASEAMLRLKGMEELERMLADLGKRHMVALEMLGERDQELRAAREDLEDAKNMFREQIEQVLTPMKKH